MAKLHKKFTSVHLQVAYSMNKNKNLGSQLMSMHRPCVFWAYPYVQQGTQEAEKLGQMVLTNQFATGLRGDIKMKVVGVEGSFDQMLTRARFE